MDNAALLALATKHIDQLDAELLLAHVLNKPREFVIAHPEERVSLIKRLAFHRLVKKRARNIPLAHLTGTKEFFGLTFYVNKYTLVPRPDTEVLVEAVLKKLTALAPHNPYPGCRKKDITIIDVGTSTGCIPISVLCNTKTFIDRAIATDISKPAIAVAKQNAHAHSVPLDVLHGNLLDPVSNNIEVKNLDHVLITANLPYLTQEQFDTEPSIQHEPHTALVADEQGLALYKKMFEQIKKIRDTGSGIRVTCYAEIDPSQAQLATDMIKKYFPNASVDVLQDLCGRDRVIQIEMARKQSNEVD